MMKRTVYLIVTLLLCSGSAMAQERYEVVVTREYQPNVSLSKKLDFAPRELDSAKIEPDFEYKIIPTPLTPDTKLYYTQPESIDFSQRILHYPFYLRAGFGVPIRSLLDIYAVTGGYEKRPVWGAYLNHDGAFAALKNDTDVWRSALVMHNNVGGYFSQNWGIAHLEASLDYQLSHYNPYGQFTATYIAPESAPGGLLYYGDISARAMYSVDNQVFSYAISGKGGYFYDGIGDGSGYADLYGQVSWTVGIGRLSILLPVSYDGGAKPDFRIGVVPGYKFNLGKFLDFDLGAKLIYDNHSNLENRLYFYPNFEVKYTPEWRYFMPYFSWTGELGSGSKRTVVARNPYLDGLGFFIKNPSVSRFRAGFSGNFAQRITYDIFGGAHLWRDYIYFVAHTSGLFTAESQRIVNQYFIGASMAVHPIAELEFRALGRYNYYDPVPDVALGMPRWEARLEANYHYRDRFYATIGADILGNREFATADVASGLGRDLIPVATNLFVELEGRISPTINVFLRGENLLNRRIELYDHYFLPGISIMVGIKVVF